MSKRYFECLTCGHRISIPFGVSRPTHCPDCGSVSIYRIDQDINQINERSRRKSRGWRRKVRTRYTHVYIGH